jgi:hypothetical protein
MDKLDERMISPDALLQCHGLSKEQRESVLEGIRTVREGFANPADDARLAKELEKIESDFRLSGMAGDGQRCKGFEGCFVVVLARCSLRCIVRRMWLMPIEWSAHPGGASAWAIG